jgi:hypothetical protein
MCAVVNRLNVYDVILGKSNEGFMFAKSKREFIGAILGS